MYRRLTQRDIMKEGDEYRTNWGTWRLIEPRFVGKRKGSVFGWTLKMRRKHERLSLTETQRTRQTDGGQAQRI